MEQTDILIIGGGAAGIAAAKAIKSARVLLVDRKASLGGVLLQCSHRGFGQEQTGQEYAAALCEDFPRRVRLSLNTTVLSVTADRTALLSTPEGRRQVRFSQLILATGCREIPIGALPVAGTRPDGIYTAGQMQEMMNLHGVVPPGPVVILGSGDLGLVMAAQLSRVGLSVTLVEQRNACGGMARNQRCLKNPLVKLVCGTTLTRVHGHGHLQGCTLANGAYLPCATLLIAAGLRPEQTLIASLGMPEWLHLCGNCQKVHPMVEAVVRQGAQAGMLAERML